VKPGAQHVVASPMPQQVPRQEKARPPVSQATPPIAGQQVSPLSPQQTKPGAQQNGRSAGPQQPAPGTQQVEAAPTPQQVPTQPKEPSPVSHGTPGPIRQQVSRLSPQHPKPGAQQKGLASLPQQVASGAQQVALAPVPQQLPTQQKGSSASLQQMDPITVSDSGTGQPTQQKRLPSLPQQCEATARTPPVGSKGTSTAEQQNMSSPSPQQLPMQQNPASSFWQH
jgi:hypothetical protein